MALERRHRVDGWIIDAFYLLHTYQHLAPSHPPFMPAAALPDKSFDE